MTPLVQHEETSSLLPSPDSDSTSRHGLSGCKYLRSSAVAVTNFWTGGARPILLCTFLLQFLISFAKYVTEVPIIRLFELAACHQYYDHQNRVVGPVDRINENLCKVPQVQDELSLLTGFKFGFDAVPGLLLAVYYGSVAGKYGRRSVLLLFSTGMILSLTWIVLVCWVDRMPIRLVWLSSFFLLIGGGGRVARAMLFTIVSDVVDVQHRTRYMYLLSSIPHITTLIAPPLSGIFMNISVWLPFPIAGGALMLTYLLAWVIPESLDFNGANDINSDSPSFDDTDEERPLLWPVTQPSETPVNASPTKRPWFVQVLDLLRSPGLRICLMLFFLTPFALLAKSFVYQYASESFDWPMSRTTWLRVSQAAGASLVTIIFLPLLNAFLHKRGVHAQTIDLNVIRASLFVAAVGFAMLWQANVSWLLILALFVCGLSEGLQPSNQGLATSFIKREYNARMFTTVAVLETVGKLVGGPLQSKLFSIGRDDRHDSFGINFLASSIVFALLLLIFVLFVRVKR